MTRSELIEKIAADNPSLSKREAERLVRAIFDEIITTLAQGGRVELRGFGAFSVKNRDGRDGRNPRTGEAVKVQSKAVPFFKAGKGLRDRMNGRGQ